MTLARRVSAAVAWSAALRVLTRGLALFTTLALARLIPPDQYGTYATIAIANQGLQAIAELALTDALMQRPGDVRPYLATVWSLTIIKGFMVFGLMFAIAPAFCEYFGVPEATDMLRVLALVQIISGFHSLGPTLLRRDLAFSRVFLVHTSEAISFSVFAIGLGALRHDSWALVIAVLASFTVRVVVSHLIAPAPVRFGFEMDRLRELVRFSKWVNANILVEFVLEAAGNVTVARLLGPATLAFYRMGYQLATEGSSALPWVMTTVAFPAFARIQFDAAHVGSSFRGLLGLVAAALIPLTVGLTLFAQIAVPLLLGPQWALAGPPLTVLATAALGRGVVETARPVLLGLGHSRADFILRAAHAVMLVALILPAGTVFGVMGVAWGVTAAAALSLPIWVVVLIRSAGLRPADLVNPLIAPAIAGVATTAVLLALPAPSVTWTDLVIRSAVLVAVYGCATMILYRRLPNSGLSAARAAAR